MEKKYSKIRKILFRIIFFPITIFAYLLIIPCIALQKALIKAQKINNEIEKLEKGKYFKKRDNK